MFANFYLGRSQLPKVTSLKMEVGDGHTRGSSRLLFSLHPQPAESVSLGRGVQKPVLSKAPQTFLIASRVYNYSLRLKAEKDGWQGLGQALENDVRTKEGRGPQRFSCILAVR